MQFVATNDEICKFFNHQTKLEVKDVKFRKR